MAPNKSKKGKNPRASRTFRISTKVGSRFKEKTTLGLNAYLLANDFRFEPTCRKLTGTKALKDNTEHSYAKHYVGLYKFAAIIGDYESLLILEPAAPTTFCPSMKATTVALYMRYKLLEKGDILQDQNDQDVLNVFGEPIKCVRDWKDPGNLDQFLSAVGEKFLAKTLIRDFQMFIIKRDIFIITFFNYSV